MPLRQLNYHIYHPAQVQRLIFWTALRRIIASSVMEPGPMSVDSAALEPPALPENGENGANEPKHGGHSRFELELEVRPRSRPLFQPPGS
jgi:hypothetical protein